MSTNRTHDASKRSWVESANDPDTDFPLQNLPHGVFSTPGKAARGGVAIGDRILDIQAWIDAGLAPSDVLEVAREAAKPELNGLLAMGNRAARRLREALFDFLCEDSGSQRADLLVSMDDASLHLPVYIRSFTDFMTSVHHVTAARKSRPARPLNENFLHLPVAYNSRSSSVTVDGVAFPRPWGQRREESGEVVFEPSSLLDFEVEFGALIGPGNTLGQRVSLDDAEDQLFGYLLVNDWSARDIQLWEMRLGPFLGKSFRTTVSPWIITSAALEPFRVAPQQRSADEPRLLPYLDSAAHQKTGAIDVALRATLTSRQMREDRMEPLEIVRTNLQHCAWTLAQMLTHHTSNGCNMESGDLISSGTVSGPTDEEAACLFERTAGVLPLTLPTGEERLWLEDGDELVITGRASRQGYRSIGFGSCGAEILPADPG
jgi:fumarylacetoacetase